MKKKMVSILTAAFCVSALLAGCGFADTAKTSASSAGAASSSADGTTTFTVGFDAEYPPYGYMDDETGDYTGFDLELAEAVCEIYGWKLVKTPINWDAKDTELNSGAIDCIWNGLTLTDDREANMTCTKPYVKNAQVVVMKADADYTSTADLAGKTVVAESGSAGETTIEEDEGLQQADFVAKSVQTDCLMEVAAGTADAAVLDLTLASAMIGEGTDYANLVIKDELNVEEYGAAFRKGSDVAAAVDTAFDELKADGTMQTLADKYGLTLAD